MKTLSRDEMKSVKAGTDRYKCECDGENLYVTHPSQCRPLCRMK